MEGPRYLTSWDGFVEFLRSGGVFYGGLLGAVVALAVMLRKKAIGFWTFADMAAPSVALGHAIGRLGCLSAGCCWGRECHLPVGDHLHDPAAERNVGVPLHVPLHPTQLYEAAAPSALRSPRRRSEGPASAARSSPTYLGLYALLRGTIEFFRGDPRGAVLGGAVSTSQLIALGGVLAALAIWGLNRKQTPPKARRPEAVSGGRRQIRADRGDDRERLDRVLQRHLADLPEATRTKIQEWIEAGLVTREREETAKSSEKVRAGRPPRSSSAASAAAARVARSAGHPSRRPLRGFEILVLNKPAGLVVHPAVGHRDGTLVNALLFRSKEWAGPADRPGLVHRLDKDTSGVLVIAKTELRWRSWVRP